MAQESVWANSNPNTSATSQAVLWTASLYVQKHLSDITVSRNELTWTRKEKREDDHCVRLRDLIAVKVGRTCDTESSLEVVYIVQKKDFILKRHQVTFHGEPDQCESCKNILQQSIDNNGDRPKRLLVLVNPVSGFSRGVQNYRTKVAPIFQEANIATDVIVTERAHHTEEIMGQYDLKSINGLVVVGGDGLYQEAVNGIARRMASDAGSDVTNPNYVPPEFPIPIGIIPCGTGNGTATITMGNKDIVSAAYTIVLGFRIKNHLHGINSSGRLLTYGIMLIGYGLWGDIIDVAESKRHLGVLRYPYAIIGGLIKKFRRLSLSVEMKVPVEFGDHNTAMLSAASLQHTVDQGASDSNIIKQSVTGEFMNVLYCGAPFLEMFHWFKKPDMPRVPNITNIGLNKMCSRTEFVKIFWKFTGNGDTSDPRPWRTAPMLAVTEFSVSLNGAHPKGTDLGTRERILNVDGEVFHLEEPSFSINCLTEGEEVKGAHRRLITESGRHVVAAGHY